jgi:hypothetical protein
MDTINAANLLAADVKASALPHCFFFLHCLVQPRIRIESAVISLKKMEVKRTDVTENCEPTYIHSKDIL